MQIQSFVHHTDALDIGDSRDPPAGVDCTTELLSRQRVCCRSHSAITIDELDVGS